MIYNESELLAKLQDMLSHLENEVDDYDHR